MDFHGHFHLELVLFNAPLLHIRIVADHGTAIMAVRSVIFCLNRLVESPSFDGILIVLPHRILSGGSVNKRLCAGPPGGISILFMDQNIKFHLFKFNLQ